MKNLIIKSALTFILTGVSLAMASDSGTTIGNVENAEYRIVSPTELNEDEIKQFCRGRMEGVILSIEGTILSFNISLDSDFLDTEEPASSKVKVLKPAFIKCEKGIHYFSADTRTWKSFKDFFDNNLDVSFHLDNTTYLINIILHLRLSQKNSSSIEATMQDLCTREPKGGIFSIEGSTMVFNVSLDSDFLDVQEHTSSKAKVLKPGFIKCEKGIHYFSLDTKNWKNFHDSFDNNLDVSFDVDDSTSLININMHLTLYQKN